MTATPLEELMSSPFDTVSAEERHRAIRRELNNIGWYSWSFWGFAVVVTICLTVAVVSFSFSSVTQSSEPFLDFHIRQSARGLVALVLLFGFFSLYQQVQLRRMRARLAEQVELSAEHAIRAESFLHLAMLDSLTGLHNRRFAEERLSAELARARRNGNSLVVLMTDLDDFKQINDRYGHWAGDLALKMFADRLSRAIRGSDLATRVGGDEFLVLLPECDESQVNRVLDRLPRLEIKFESEMVPFGYSAGWASYRKDETLQELIKRADQALYAEKQMKKVCKTGSLEPPRGSRFSNANG